MTIMDKQRTMMVTVLTLVVMRLGFEIEKPRKYIEKLNVMERYTKTLPEIQLKIKKK